ncbi:Fructose-1-phosphate phosphatase YqaB [Pirellulimonas nuda]|uniref:Fructose-1-phosphate phosphatase YqaB n=1 Tax=Pirellulimonas nuda TaxID=2528009 RepID=A0A518D8U6_9BACT|nr:HAD family phosphatase [Pirellulimonas nuda]QDU87870.1 Fructose-1-phosphate phosphatase YqaB [Pirellulimonas nuda]
MLAPHVTGLIFDCDGTLTDSMPTHYLAWKQAFDHHHVAFSLERFYSLAGMPSDRIIGLMSEESGVPLNPEELSVEKEENFLRLLDQVPPVAKVVELARREKGLRKLAVASGGFRWVIDRQLAHIGLSDWFDAIVTAEDTELHKPHPDVFLEAARQMGVAPENCVVFEDAELGLEAARRAGMAAIDVRGAEWGSSSV